MARTEVSELKEKLRETDFKLRAVSLILSDLLEHAPAGIKSRAHAALFDLTYLRVATDSPLVFTYNGDKITVE